VETSAQVRHSTDLSTALGTDPGTRRQLFQVAQVPINAYRTCRVLRYLLGYSIISDTLDEKVASCSPFRYPKIVASHLHQPMSDYQREWQQYKRLRNQFLLVFAGYVPVCFTVAAVSIKSFHTFTPGFFVAFFWMVLFLFTGFRAQMWRCPRCGKWFSATWWYNLGFLARRCVHCGLRKYEN
jgi:hypothetical protein